ncbi:MAG: hypothetical protein IJX88_04720 [Clostridia bacterium]|nr:hypothetical protein [Clostridia bacterium]
MKREAEEKAAHILAEAEMQAKRMEESSAEVCKAFLDTQIKNVKVDASRFYDEQIETRKKTAREYCAKVLENAEETVSQIVGRILRGNR